MNGYKGKVVFTKSIKYGNVNTWHDDMADMVINGDLADHVLLAVIEVDVAFVDTRQQEIEAYERAIEQERAESQQRISMILGKIQELQAITHE